MLRDVTFVVREAGRQRVLREGCKNVHAFAKGWIILSGMGTDAAHGKLPVTISYNPHNDNRFFALESGKWTTKLAACVTGADVVILNQFGMSAAYVDFDNSTRHVEPMHGVRSTKSTTENIQRR
jgi:hypothetical protein